MPVKTEYPVSETLARLKATPKTRRVCLIEGVAGAGKSTFAETLALEWGGSSLHLSTDAFLKVTRAQWTEHLAKGAIELVSWYDLAKIEKAVRQYLAGEQVCIENIYNLSNGEHDLTVEHDAGPMDLLVIEGLFAFDELLSQYADLKVFLDLDTSTAKSLARERDLTVRNLSPEAFLQKESIYYDCYMPFLSGFKNAADLVLTR